MKKSKLNKLARKRPFVLACFLLITVGLFLPKVSIKFKYKKTKQYVIENSTDWFYKHIEESCKIDGNCKKYYYNIFFKTEDEKKEIKDLKREGIYDENFRLILKIFLLPYLLLFLMYITLILKFILLEQNKYLLNTLLIINTFMSLFVIGVTGLIIWGSYLMYKDFNKEVINYDISVGLGYYLIMIGNIGVYLYIKFQKERISEGN